MTQYKYIEQLEYSALDAFDRELEQVAQLYIQEFIAAGCGDEIGIAKNHSLPPQNDYQHPVSRLSPNTMEIANPRHEYRLATPGQHHLSHFQSN